MSEMPNIRGVFWGDSPEKVKATESWDQFGEGFGRPTDTYGDWIVYRGHILEEPCLLKYWFEENRLFEIDYEFSPSPMQLDKANSFYTDLQALFEDKYDPFLPVSTEEYPPHMYLGKQNERLSRCITHYSENFVDGGTVIDLYLKHRRPTVDSGLFAVGVLMWQNGGGSGANPFYKIPLIDEDKKRERLFKEAREQI